MASSSSSGGGGGGTTTSGHSLVIGCVGKPSAGKSSFLNAATEANAKTGNFPFTTIDPNFGIGYYQCKCPCVARGAADRCGPRYGRCASGVRDVPVQVLDVAGLVPGASEGAGLGNRFLDDLRQAHVLLHIIDASGNTNEKGEETSGYDPLRDVDWLRSEIHAWVFNNLWKKWDRIVRRHVTTKSTGVKSLQLQLSGYGVHLPLVQTVFDRLGHKEPVKLQEWDRQTVVQLVDVFLDIRFPIVLVLNKADCPSADANIAKISRKYAAEQVVICSAKAECFLKRLRKQGYVDYEPGTDRLITAVGPDPNDDFFIPDEPEVAERRALLKKPDPPMLKKIEGITDLLLFRYGSTGVQEAIQRAVDTLRFVPVFPVRSLKSYACDEKNKAAFRDCFLVRPLSTINDIARLVGRPIIYAEDVNGRRLALETEILASEDPLIIRVQT